MNTQMLRCYMHENRRLHGVLLYEWLLEQAKRQGVQGGSVFRAIAGFGRHGVLHEQQFFELAGDVPVVVEFILSTAQADALIELLRAQGVALTCVRWSVESIVLPATPPA